MTVLTYKRNSSINCGCKLRTTYKMLLLACSSAFATGWLKGQRDLIEEVLGGEKKPVLVLDLAKAAQTQLVPIAADLGGAWP